MRRSRTRERPSEATIEPGIERTSEFVVEDRLVTDVGGTIGISVLSTPGMIGDDGAERGDPLLRAPAGGQGDGRLRGLREARRRGGGGRDAAPSRATLREVVDGRKLRFDVEVSEGERTIGVGTHERRVIDVGVVKSE